MTFDELNDAMGELAWHKAPCCNGATPNAIKKSNELNRINLLQFAHAQIDYPDPHHED